MRQIVFDTETTGMNFNTRDKSEGHRIIELGCVEMINRRPTGKYLHYYFKPDREVEAEAIGVHGITDDFLADKPTFVDTLKSIEAFLANADELIAHNSDFDCQFINRELKLAKRNYRIEERFKVVDSLQIARKRFPGQKNNLDALCKRFSIDNSSRDKHGALLDSELLLEVYLKLTGGQSSLFTNNKYAPVKNTPTATDKAASDSRWLTITLSDTELEKHKEIIRNIRII